MKKLLLLPVGMLAGLFAVYYYNLDMKLMYFVMLPLLDRYHDNVQRERYI